MSILDPMESSTGSNWNYSDSEKDNFALRIDGTVVALGTPQALDFNSRQPKFWPDGNPVLNVSVTLEQADGSDVTWTFSPGGKKEKMSVAMRAIVDACTAAGLKPSVRSLAGKNVTIWTQDGAYNAKHPRPWGVQINGEGTAEFRGIDEDDANNRPASASRPAAQSMQQVAQSNPMMAQAMQQAANAIGAKFQEVPPSMPAPMPVPQPSRPAPVQQQAYYDQDIPF